MRRKDEERAAAKLAKAMAMICVRNTMLENIHAGRAPRTKSGDYSDVFVVDAEGNSIPWREVSHIDDNEMRDLMWQVVISRWIPGRRIVLAPDMAASS